MVDQNERGIVGGQGSIGLAVVVQGGLLLVAGTGAAAAKDATVPAGSAEDVAIAESVLLGDRRCGELIGRVGLGGANPKLCVPRSAKRTAAGRAGPR
jgi:hypothetical protein